MDFYDKILPLFCSLTLHYTRESQGNVSSIIHAYMVNMLKHSPGTGYSAVKGFNICYIQGIYYTTYSVVVE